MTVIAKTMPPVRLEATYSEKVWGVPSEGRLPDGKKLGEIWFHAQPLLLKFVLTSEKLSVQVHPDDGYAAQHEAARGGKGKTELWYVAAAAPGARLAVGLNGPMAPEEIQRAALDGSIEQRLRWMEVKRGDAVFVPAGTVHALGAGLTIFEIQQYCDITYRLFDYGRPRELHLQEALSVIRDVPGAGPVDLPFSCPYFRVEAIGGTQPREIPSGLLAVLEGAGTVGDLPYGAREVWRLQEPGELRPRQPTQCLLVNP